VIPPKIIVPNRVKDSPGSFIVNHRRDFRFFLAFAKEAINSHHPPNEETVLFNGLKAVGRTSGKARAAVPIDGRDMFFVKIHQPEGRIETSYLIGRGGRFSRGYAIGVEDHKPKNKKG
jgi:hypothetical protein